MNQQKKKKTEQKVQKQTEKHSCAFKNTSLVHSSVPDSWSESFFSVSSKLQDDLSSSEQERLASPCRR